MFNRKIRQRLEWVFRLALVALIINIVIPINTTSAKAVSASLPPKASDIKQPIVQHLPEIANKPVIVKRRVTVRSSAYSSTRDQTDNDPFTTASGSKVHDGTVAMNGIAFGTKIRIPEHYGDKIFVVEDRMHARWGNKRVDIWMPSREQAREWGVRTVTIEII